MPWFVLVMLVPEIELLLPWIVMVVQVPHDVTAGKPDVNAAGTGAERSDLGGLAAFLMRRLPN